MTVTIVTAGETKTVSYSITAPVSTVVALDGSAFDPDTGLVSPTHAQDYINKTTRYGGFYNMPRPFFGPTNALDWASAAVACLKAGEVPVISRKIPAAGLTRAELETFINSVPDKFPTVFLCLHHEPRTSKPDVTPALYKQMYELLADVLSKSAKRSKFKVVKILMSYQLRFGGQNWRDFVVHADGKFYCDVFGLDAYNESWTPAAKANGGYEPAADSHKPAWDIKAATGLPVAITECGATRLAGDDGTKQLKWFQDSLALAQANGALWWAPWADNADAWVYPDTDNDIVTNWLKPKIIASQGKAATMAASI